MSVPELLSSGQRHDGFDWFSLQRNQHLKQSLMGVNKHGLYCRACHIHILLSSHTEAWIGPESGLALKEPKEHTEGIFQANSE